MPPEHEIQNQADCPISPEFPLPDGKGGLPAVCVFHYNINLV